MSNREGQRLILEAGIDRDEFEALYYGEECSCFLGHPPCGWCTHPGNPVNQAEDDSCWETDPDVAQPEAKVDYSAITRSMCK